MYQYYVIELQQYQDGTYGNLTHFTYDNDDMQAELKGWEKYYQVLAAAAMSQIPGHGAIQMSSRGRILDYKYFEKWAPDQVAVTQYYVIELQKYMNGEYGNITHIAYDADGNKARLKGDSKYYEILSAAAISGIAEHAVVLLSSEAFPLDQKCYLNNS